MNPKPFSALKNFTVPVANAISSLCLGPIPATDPCARLPAERHGTVRAMRLSVEPARRADAYPFHQRIRVRFAETDAMGVVHHAAYLPYLESARVEYLRSVGHPYA